MSSKQQVEKSRRASSKRTSANSSVQNKPWLKLADPKLETSTGWICPDGHFYPCEYFGHTDLAYDIEEAGYPLTWKEIDTQWLKISSGKIITCRQDLTPRMKKTLIDIILKFDLLGDGEEELTGCFQLTRNGQQIKIKKWGF